MLPHPDQPGLHRHPRSTPNLKQGVPKKADWQVLFSQSRVLLKEWEKSRNLHQSTSTSKLHVKPAVSASSRQIALTCKPVPKLHKTCLSIHPKHIKFLLQEHMVGSLKAPHTQPTQAAEPPRIPWVTQKPASTEAQRITDGILHPFLFQAKAVGRMHILYVSEQTKY